MRPEAKWLVAEGADAAALTRSIPIEKCLDDAMLVYSQNGERLRPQQGYPLRLLLPGFEGNMNVKWLRRLKAVDRAGLFARGDLEIHRPDAGRHRARIHLLHGSEIHHHPALGRAEAEARTGFHEITGIAWSGHGKIKRVDVSVDGGKNWQEAQLQEPVLTRALTRFRLPWQWDGQPAVIQSRAIDETGYVQPTFAELLAVRGENSFYHNNAIQPWRIDAQGQVTNAECLNRVGSSLLADGAGIVRAGADAQGHYGIGRPATPAEIAGWNIDIGRDGANLPPGSGTVAHGQRGVRAAMRGLPWRERRGRRRRSPGRRPGHDRDAKADQDRRQLLALCADAVRLHPPRDAAERAAIAQQ